MKITIPVEAGNKAIGAGSLPATIEATMERLQPEAVYFTPSEGERCALVVFDLADTADIPTISEPLFQNLNARVEFSPVMDRDDLQSGLSRVG